MRPDRTAQLIGPPPPLGEVRLFANGRGRERRPAGLLTVWVKTGTLAASAVASAPAPTVIIAGVVLAYAVVTHDGYHLAADHDDLVAYGTELALVSA
jgi:hypothetical protein